MPWRGFPLDAAPLVTSAYPLGESGALRRVDEIQDNRTMEDSGGAVRESAKDEPDTAPVAVRDVAQPDQVSMPAGRGVRHDPGLIGVLDSDAVLSMQRTAGNRTVTRYLERAQKDQQMRAVLARAGAVADPPASGTVEGGAEGVVPAEEELEGQEELAGQEELE
jgi:hypothetical protein